MRDSVIQFLAEDRQLSVLFDPPLTRAMCDELHEILAGPNTVEEVLAVVTCLGEDWHRTVTTTSAFALLAFELATACADGRGWRPLPKNCPVPLLP